jgi:putative membrane protein
MAIIPLLFLAGLIAVVVLLVRSAAGAGGIQPPVQRRSPGLDALEERYARGDINREEYLQKRRDILG